MGAYDYVNTNCKPYVDVIVALTGNTPGAGGVPFVNTDPKAYIDAEYTAAGGSSGTGYTSADPRAYIESGAATLLPADPPDTTPPNTTITQGPTGTTSDNTPTFVFTSSEPASTFETKMDSGSWVASTSPKTYGTLADGAHTFQVRATDAAGNTDPTPASQAFTIETTAFPPTGMSLVWSGTTVSDWDAVLIEDAPSATITDESGYIRFNMPTPSSASGDRVELQTSGAPLPVPGDEGYYEWEFYIPSSVTIDPRDSDGYVTINQFHGNENAGYTGGFGITDTEELHVRVEGGYRLDSNNYGYEEELKVGDFSRNTWHKIGYHVKWDMSYQSESPTGFAIAYLDGVEGARVEDVPTMGDKRVTGRIAGTGPTTAVMFRCGWYPQYVGATGLEMRVRNVKVYM